MGPLPGGGGGAAAPGAQALGPGPGPWGTGGGRGRWGESPHLLGYRGGGDNTNPDPASDIITSMGESANTKRQLTNPDEDEKKMPKL